MGKWAISTLCGGILLVAVAGIPAFGATFTFNFNSLTGYSSSAGNQESSIASQLTTQLHTVCPACSVIATGGSTAAVIDKTYTGEGYVVGPTSGSNVMPETLGDTPGPTAGVNNPNVSGDVITGNSQYSYATLNSDGYSNQFLSNTNDSSNQLANEISFQFSGLTITGASFNFEAFPSNGGAAFEFEAGTNTSGTDPVISSQNGVKPCATVNGCGGAPAGTDGSSTVSPNDNPETNVQWIGSWSGNFAASTELDFVDWPPTIGIDNLTITYNTPSGVPEPGSLLLLATAALGAVLIARRRPRQA